MQIFYMPRKSWYVWWRASGREIQGEQSQGTIRRLERFGSRFACVEICKRHLVSTASIPVFAFE